MFATLVESGGTRKTHSRWLAVSAVIHALLLGAVATQSRTAQGRETTTHEPSRIVWVAPRDPAHGNSPASGASASTAAMPTRRAMPRFDPVPAVDLPDIPAPGIGEPATEGDFRPAITGTGTPGRGDLSSGAGDGARWAADVEKVALPLPGNAVPAYPGALRSASIEGSVTLRFVIDTLGGVERGSPVVMRSDHPLFTAAALRALEKHRFLPAEAGSRKVRMLVEQRFEFAMSAMRD